MATIILLQVILYKLILEKTLLIMKLKDGLLRRSEPKCIAESIKSIC
jgi:hypothetical protein